MGLLWLAVTGRLERAPEAWRTLWSGKPPETPTQAPRGNGNGNGSGRRTMRAVAQPVFAGLPPVLNRAFL
jgi:hypothetical protein